MTRAHRPLGYDSDRAKCAADGGSDNEWETDIDDERMMYIANAVREQATRICTEEYNESKPKKARAQTVVHTPQSWHSLLHAGKDHSLATAIQGNARFNIGARLRWGNELNKTERDILEQAGKDCKVCKVTKLSAAAARKGGKAMEVHNDPVPAA